MKGGKTGRNKAYFRRCKKDSQKYLWKTTKRHYPIWLLGKGRFDRRVR
jgi:hypothetical protein